MLPDPADLDRFFEELRTAQPKPAEAASGLPGPFLTIVTRTQGKRIGPLRDALVCLEAQTDQNFELLLMLHRVSADVQGELTGLVAGFPDAFRSRVRMVSVESGGRATPLNVAISEAAGMYLAVLDDDDLVFDHWVESFHGLLESDPNKVLRTICLTQDFDEICGINGEPAARASGPIARRYAPTFDWLEHFADNASPLPSFAFPLAAVRAHELLFDESFTTLEDWDFVVRTCLACGVVSLPEPTSIYRLWRVGENSVTAEGLEAWERNRTVVERKIADHPFVVAAGGLDRLQRLQRERGPIAIEVDAYTLALRQELRSLYASSSWRFSSPVRKFAVLLGRPGFKQPDVDRLDKGQVVRYIGTVRRSLSWRVTGPLRVLSRLIRRWR